MEQLEMIRNRIDQVDAQIVDLLEERLALAGEVAAYKKETGKAVFDPVREREKIEKVRQLAKTDYLRDELPQVYELLMEISKNWQKRLMEGEEAEVSHE